MCVDIHPQHPHMVVAGLYDGNVAVYNLQTKQGKPSYLSHPHNGISNLIKTCLPCRFLFCDKHDLLGNQLYDRP